MYECGELGRPIRASNLGFGSFFVTVTSPKPLEVRVSKLIQAPTTPASVMFPSYHTMYTKGQRIRANQECAEATVSTFSTTAAVAGFNNSTLSLNMTCIRHAEAKSPAPSCVRSLDEELGNRNLRPISDLKSGRR